MKIRLALASNLSVLANMNHQLILDEGHRNSMKLNELEVRMQAWLNGSYIAALFSKRNEDIGYTIWREEPEFIYIRQFYISKSHRRMGYGRGAISELKASHWLEKKLRLDVLVDNIAGKQFWNAVGFNDYCHTLECRNNR